jgi:hypothetical protein
MMTKSALLRWIEEIENKLAELRAAVTQWSETEEAVSAEALTDLEQELIVRNWQISPKILKLLEMRHENASSSSLSNRDSDSGGA